MVSTDLAPRDSAAPIVRALEPGGPFSPNGDGQVDTTTISGRFTETVAWKLRVRNAGGDVLFEKTGSGSTFQAVWDGLVNGARGPRRHLHGERQRRRRLGQRPGQRDPFGRHRHPRPDAGGAHARRRHHPVVRPERRRIPRHGLGRRDERRAREPDRPRPRRQRGALVKKWTVENGDAAETLTWNGQTTAGAVAPDGIYTIRVAPQDVAGNVGEGVDRTVKLVAALRSVASSRSIFFPQDNDSLSKATTLSFALARPMTVTWTIRNAAGQVVDTHLRTPRCRPGPSRGLLRQDAPTARCSRAAATPRS